MEGDDRVGSIEVFIFQTAQFAAVDSIGKVGSKLLHIEQSRTAPRFFIRRKADADRSVSDVRVLDEVFHSADDSRDARFIVGPEEGRPISEEDVLPLVFQDFWKSLRRKDDALCFVEDDILPVIISDPDGLDVLPRCIGTGIDMRNEADDRAFCPLAGSVAMIYPCSSKVTSDKPIAFSSSAKPWQRPAVPVYSGRRHHCLHRTGYQKKHTSKNAVQRVPCLS